ncbi:MAG: nicotinate-nucleotide adenylyltransferase [Lachnospiraceae bacterium]|nr:nicotinate-nucleotide adenylyltransferase [Lachnospiraceae bacterium]
MKIGILGGTFNPIHLGHLLIAENAYEQFNLDYVNIMPAYVSPFKLDSNVLDKEHRKAIIKLSIKDNPHFKLDTREIDSEQISYTYITLSEMKKKNPEDELYFILGADSLKTIKKWRNPQIIFDNATILAAVRDNDDMDDLKRYADEINELFNGKVGFIKTPTYDVSSTDIRERFKNCKSVKYMMADDAIKYINDNNLYREQRS